MDLKETGILGDKLDEHWYYRSKANAVCALLGDHAPHAIADIGAGSGFFARMLLTQTEAHRAVCIDTGYERERSETIAGKAIQYRRRPAAEKFDTLLFLDVLEHVDDDRQLLQMYRGHAAPQALFVLSVPAFQFLWSGHDEFLEHRRRYTRRDLLDLGRQAGLEPLAAHYYFGLVFPIVAMSRLGQRLRPRRQRYRRSQLRRHSQLVNETLAALCAIERPVMRYNRLAGLTVFGVFRNS